MLHKYLYMCAAEDGALIKTKQGVAMEVGAGRAEARRARAAAERSARSRSALGRGILLYC